jgi:DNA repair exonuclease SbcCD ATPase subunit
MSAIKLKSLEWGNMFSYGEKNFLDLTKNVMTQLDAINGSGKTALVLIIQEILFSKNMKGIKKGNIVNRYSNSDTWYGILDFDIDENQYKLHVTRKGETSKVAFTENGKSIAEHKIPDTYKKILSLLGTTAEVLNQFMYQSSNSQLEFLKATDTNRKKFLVGLFNLEKYLAIGEIIKLKVTETEKIMSTLKGEEKVVVEFLSQPNLDLEPKQKKPVPDVDESLRTEIRDLEVEISNYNNLCSIIDKNNLHKQDRNSLKFSVDMEDIDQEKLRETVSNIQKINTEVGVLLNQINKDKKSLSSLDTATHCPTCKQPIDNSHSIQMAEGLKASISETQTKINEYQNTLVGFKNEESRLNKEHKAFLDNKDAINKFETLSGIINTELPDTYPDIAKTKVVLEDKKQKLKSQIEAQSDAIKFNSDVDILNAKIETIVKQKREFLARQELVTSDIINTQLKLDRLTTLRKAFSPTGIVAFKLENIIKEFENEINEYLVELSDGQFQISFRLEGEKLNIVVFSSGVESPIETASEGEFSRIQTATLLAIRKLLSKIGGVQLNFLFLDEVMGVLDLKGKERLIEILQKEENTNTFLVAHEFSHPLVPKIHIVKENNIARIV